MVAMLPFSSLFLALLLVAGCSSEETTNTEINGAFTKLSTALQSQVNVIVLDDQVSVTTILTKLGELISTTEHAAEKANLEKFLELYQKAVQEDKEALLKAIATFSAAAQEVAKQIIGAVFATDVILANRMDGAITIYKDAAAEMQKELLPLMKTLLVEEDVADQYGSILLKLNEASTKELDSLNGDLSRKQIEEKIETLIEKSEDGQKVAVREYKEYNANERNKAKERAQELVKGLEGTAKAKAEEMIKQEFDDVDSPFNKLREKVLAIYESSGEAEKLEFLKNHLVPATKQ